MQHEFGDDEHFDDDEVVRCPSCGADDGYMAEAWDRLSYVCNACGLVSDADELGSGV